jgi:DNA-binding transcriptional LysR family regulator
MARPTFLNLETAVWVARLGTFTSAAQKLNTTQPAVSLRIRELEAALGITLFRRHGHGMEPTVHGREFLHRIEPLIGELQEALSAAAHESAARGVVRLGSGDIPMTWFGELIGRLQRDMPGVNYELHIGIASRLLAQLEEGKLDLVIVAGRIEYPTLASASLGHTPMQWVMGADRWQRFGSRRIRKAPTLAQLLNSGPIWLIPRTSHYFASQSAMLKAKGAHLRNVSSCDNMATLTDVVTRGGGIGYLPRVLIEERLAKGELLPLPGLDAGADAEYFIVSTRAPQQRVLRRIVELAHQYSAFAR